MSRLEVLSVAVENLRHQGIRTYLTLLGVIIGIAAIVALVSIGEGLNVSVTQQFEKLGSNTIFVAVNIGGGSSSDGMSSGGMPSSGQIQGLSDTDITRMRNTIGIDSVFPVKTVSSTAKFRNETIPVSLLGVDPRDYRLFSDVGFVEVGEGRALDASDTYAIIIGSTLAKDAFKNPVGIRNTLLISGKKFTVVGIAKETSSSFGGGPNVNNTIFATDRAFKQVFPDSQPLFALVRSTSKDNVQDAADRITAYFDRKYGEKTFTVTTSKQVLERIQSVLGVISLFLVGIAGISLLVGGIGIMNSMLMSVMERTREIGVMKAIGATNSRILSIFLVESGLIGLVGGAIGVVLGFLVSIVISIASVSLGSQINVSLTWQLVIGVLAFAMAVGMISGFYPALRASKMDPVEALRYE
ncbi:MAG: ABC transporter permease [archaeon]